MAAEYKIESAMEIYLCKQIRTVSRDGLLKFLGILVFPCESIDRRERERKSYCVYTCDANKQCC